MNKRCVIAGALLTAVVACAFVMLFLVWNLHIFEQGIARGYQLNGTYQRYDGDTQSVSFLKDDWEWQLYGPADSVINGRFKSTEDPNLYELFDEKGEHFGIAHVAYADPDGKRGSLYLETKDGFINYTKVDNVPAFYEGTK